MTAQATARTATVCDWCGVGDVRTRQYRAGKSRSGEVIVFSLCRDCFPRPVGRPGRAKAPARKRTMYSDEVLAATYRMGGMTVRQMARWLAATVEEVGEMDAAAREREARGERKSSSPLPSYRSAYKAVRGLAAAGDIERIDMLRTWAREMRADNLGSAEAYYRLARAGEGKAVKPSVASEAGHLADAGEEGAAGFVSAYGRHWMGGAIPHSAHRTDVVLAFLEAVEDGARNPFGATVGMDSIWGESASHYPLIGARYEATDASGKEKYEKEGQKKSKYPHRLFERVVPDAELTITFPATAGEEPPDDDGQYEPPPEPQRPSGGHVVFDDEDDDGDEGKWENLLHRSGESREMFA